METNQIGILGGGQLALMLADAALKLGVKPLILAEDSYAPAAQAHPHVVLGSMRDEAILTTFFSQVNRVIFENEFVDCSQLTRVSAPFKTQFFPGLNAIQQLQDKLLQKELLRRNQIPTADFVKWDGSLDSVWNYLKSGSAVIKWARMGYDGKGVRVVEREQPKPSELQEFLKNAESRKTPIFAEKKIHFKRELAVVAARSINGEFLAYPLVISEQTQGICSRVHGPAVLFGVPEALDLQATAIAKKIAEAADLVGVFAVEFFETTDGELIVNEIAPRVHNSGHYTQDGCATSQFENHIRAVLGLPLGQVQPSPGGFAMLNILGPDVKLSAEGIALPVPGPRSHLHWYGKRQITAGRKLGHLNGTISNPSEMKALLSELDQSYQIWCKHLHSVKSKN